ncbi:hypothetical protein FIBSPDRAFT_935351, partial [Athelia psychrophila]
MTWTSKQIEVFLSFPFQELERRLLVKTTAERFDPGQRLTIGVPKSIRDWKELIAPHTPSESDIASLNRGLPPDKITDLIVLVIGQTTQDVEFTHPSVILHIKGLVVNWPTIWIWVRLLHTKFVNVRDQSSLLSKEQLETEQTRSRSGGSTDSTSKQLSTLVKKTDGVLQMLSTLWIEEGTKGRAIMGFPSCDIFSESLSHARSEIEQLVLAGCGGSAEAVAKVAFRRVAHNLHWLEQQAAETRLGPDMTDRYYQLNEDAAYAHSMHMDGPPVLRGAFRAHTGCITLLVDVMCHMLALHRPPAQLALFYVSIHIIMIQITDIRPYSGFLELLETPFLDFITRAGLMTRNFPARLQPTVKTFVGCCIDLLRKLAFFCIYRPILSRINQGLRVTAISAIMNRSDIPIAAGLLDLRSKIGPLLEAYETYKRSPPPIFCCGSRQCDSADNEGVLYRCSGCKLALYCSVACQKRDWRGPHKTLCNAMNKRAESSLPLSSPDLRWFAHLMTDDLLHPQFPRIRFAASAGLHATDMMALNFISQARPRPDVIDTTTAGPYAPDGIVGEAWHLCLGFRKSGHRTHHSTHTMAVSAILPNGDITAKITALLTYPIAKEIVAAD